MRKREIIGTQVAITDYEEVLDEIDRCVADRERIFICCAPASSLVFARRDPELATAYADAAIVTPDGKGVVLAARLLGESIKDRVYGPDLMLAHCERAERSGQRIWLLGGYDEEALSSLVASLEARFPKLSVAGSYSPPHRPLTTDESSELISRINEDSPDVVWVGIGSPKQELWMHAERGRVDAPVLCGVGAAFDFISGRVDQAPSWMQRAGLEWLYRLVKDPKRLLTRYLTTLPVFVLLVLRQSVGQRLRGSGPDA